MKFMISFQCDTVEEARAVVDAVAAIAEITAIGRASILVPYPYATDDHQTLNARAVAEAGGAMVFADKDIEDDAFADAVIGLLQDGARREQMARAAASLGRRDADERVAALAIEQGA